MRAIKNHIIWILGLEVHSVQSQVTCVLRMAWRLPSVSCDELQVSAARGAVWFLCRNAQ